MENARLMTETREALEQQTATAEVLAGHQFLARRPRAGVRCDAGEGASPLRRDDRHLLDLRRRTFPIGRGVTALAGAFRAAGAISTRPDRMDRVPARCAANMSSMSPMSADQSYRSGRSVRRAMVDLGGTRTLLLVPLRKDDALLGSITPLPPGGPALLRQADRAAAEFRGAGGHRDGERATHHRDARGLGAADRDRRGVAGHQFLARRPRPGVRCDPRKGAYLCERGLGGLLTSMASVSRGCLAVPGTRARLMSREPMIGPPKSPGYRCAAAKTRPISDLAEGGILA